LEPAVRLGAEMTAAAIGYSARDSDEPALCWFGDAAFLPHLLRTMTRKEIAADVEFHPDSTTCADRKAAALQLREQAQALRSRLKRALAKQNA
jgi:hypothetical protein